MVNILAVGALMLLGLGLMALVAVVVKLLRQWRSPEKLSNFYSYVGGVLIVLAIGLWSISPPANTEQGLLLTFISSFAFALAVLYVALAVMHANDMLDGDGGGDRGGDGEADTDRPLLQG